jgi:hypothetical protein
VATERLTHEGLRDYFPDHETVVKLLELEYTADRLMSLLHDTALFAYCYVCLGNKLGVTEPKIRDAAQSHWSTP